MSRLRKWLRQWARWYSDLALRIEDANNGIHRDPDGTPHYRRSL